MATVALIAGTVISGVSAIKSQKERKKANEKAELRDNIANRRAQRQKIREYQNARATALASAQGGGVLNSSGVAGGIGGLNSQLGEVLGYQNTISTLNSQINQAQSKASDYNGLGNLGGGLAQFGRNNGASFGDFFQGFKST